MSNIESKFKLLAGGTVQASVLRISQCTISIVARTSFARILMRPPHECCVKARSMDQCFRSKTRVFLDLTYSLIYEMRVVIYILYCTRTHAVRPRIAIAAALTKAFSCISVPAKREVATIYLVRTFLSNVTTRELMPTIFDGTAKSI